MVNEPISTIFSVLASVPVSSMLNINEYPSDRPSIHLMPSACSVPHLPSLHNPRSSTSIPIPLPSCTTSNLTTTTSPRYPTQHPPPLHTNLAAPTYAKDYRPHDPRAAVAQPQPKTCSRRTPARMVYAALSFVSSFGSRIAIEARMVG